MSWLKDFRHTINKKPLAKAITVIVSFLVIIFSFYFNYQYFFSQASVTQKSSDKNAPKFVSNEVLIKLTDKGVGSIKKDLIPSNTGLVGLDATNVKYWATKIEKVFVDGESDVSLNKWYLVTIKAKAETKDKIGNAQIQIEGLGDTSFDAILNDYAKTEGVETAEANYVFQASVLPNDTYYSTRQLYTDRDDLWGLKKISAEQAWDKTTGNGVVVAVVDTGVDYNHPDLKDNILKDSSGKIIGYNFTSKNTASFLDDHFHGTHVAGIITAAGNNDANHSLDTGTRIVGVGWNLKIMPLKGLDSNGSGSETNLTKAMKYAADNGAKVINNSWGGSGTDSALMLDTTKYVYNKGVVNVFAAGNNNADMQKYFPAGNRYVITVGASNYLDRKAGFSNFGANLDLMAPGGDSATTGGIDDYILSARLTNSTKINPSLGNYYAQARGTSMAAPYVAGAAGLIKALHPDFTVEEVKATLKDSADKVAGNWSEQYGFGRLNLTNALNMSAPPVAFLDIAEFQFYGNGTFPINGQVSARAGIQNWSLSSAVVSATPAWTSFASGNTAKNGLIANFNTASLANGKYYLKLEVTDINNQKTSTITKTLIASNDTIPPTVSFYNLKDGDRLFANSLASLQATATDNVAVSKIDFYYNGSNLACTATNDPFFSCAWPTPNKGTYTLTAKAYDYSGNVGVTAPIQVTLVGRWGK